MSIETTAPTGGAASMSGEPGEPMQRMPAGGVALEVLAGRYEHLARLHERRAEQIGDEAAAVREFGYAAVAREHAEALAEAALPGGAPPSLPEQRATARKGRSFGRCPRRPAPAAA